MSEKPNTALVPKLNDDMEPVVPNTDFSKKDMLKIQEFEEAGCPGAARISENEYKKLIGLYLDGISYHQMSAITRLPKVMIMTCSKKHRWFDARMEYMEEIQEKAKFRAVESKLKAQDFLFLLSTVFQKKIGKHAYAYMGTDDETHVDKIDSKDVMQFLKIVDSLEKLTDETRGRQPGPAPAIGLNLGDEGVTVTKNGDNSVDITPKNKALGDMLKEFADSRREAEAQKVSDMKKKKEEKE